jgi:hypothetical protein
MVGGDVGGLLLLSSPATSVSLDAIYATVPTTFAMLPELDTAQSAAWDTPSMELVHQLMIDNVGRFGMIIWYKESEVRR